MNRVSIMMGLLLVGSVAFTNVYAAKKDCKVTGKITGLDEKTTLYVVKKTGEFTVDTVAKAPVNSKGEFKFVLPQLANQEVLDVRLSTMRGSFSFISEPGNVRIIGDKANLYATESKGTQENERWNRYRTFSAVQTKERNALNMSKEGTREEKLKRFKELDAIQKQYTDSLVQNFPASIVSLYLAKVPLPMLKHEEIETLLTHFAPYFEQHRYYTEMKERYDILRKVSVGMMAPDFTVVREDGKAPISLADFKGKYVMLDFWASWCAPCRVENKHTKALFEKFNPKGLEVISFSLDSDLKAWQDAIKMDGLTWHNASDLKGGKLSPVAKKYGIDGIPAIWIIDPQGKVIGDNIRGEKLEKFLGELFNK